MHLLGSFVTVFILGLTTSVFAQESAKLAQVEGRVIHSITREPQPGVQIAISYQNLHVTTDTAGEFLFSDIPLGTYSLYISGGDVAADTVRFIANKEAVKLGNIRVSSYQPELSDERFQVPTIVLEDDMGDEENGTYGQNISGILNAGRDLFLNTASFVWSSYGFKLRGYKQNNQQVLINGVVMNDGETGGINWSQWGGLNDVFRSRTNSYGLQAFDYGFGGMNGGIYLDATAANQRKQTKFTYSLSNRQYTHRLMLTHSSGPQKGGWAYALSLSKRWAKEGYITGSFYDSYSFYVAASKTISESQTLHVTAFGSPTRKGRSAPTYQEAYDLAGSNYYNPNWGLQNGEKRNAKVSSSFQPVFLLNHEYVPSSGLRWNTTVGYQFGKTGTSTLDWYNAADPRPDYYRNLPNFYLLNDPPDTVRAMAYADAFSKDAQIKWDDLYQVNYGNIRPAPDSSFPGDSARRSLYVLGNDVDEIRKWMVSTTFQKAMGDRLNFSGGISIIGQKTESYRQLADLLGGDYFLNINSFAERIASGTSGTTYTQYDMNYPDRVVRAGEKYYYNYLLRLSKTNVWAQAVYSPLRWDVFLAGEAGSVNFQREGLYRNGLYAAGNGSFGKSPKYTFITSGLKGGITYKFNGRNYLFSNACFRLEAPTVDNTFFAVRVRNTAVVNPINQKLSSGELGYLLKSPQTNIRAVGYVTDIQDQVGVQRFYYQGTGGANTFVNYVMQHLDSRSIGAELAVSQQLTSGFTLSAVAALGQSFYTNNPEVTIYEENTPDTTPQQEQVYIQNYYIGVGPQSAYSLAMNYRSKRYWYGTLTANYLERNYINLSAPRRTPENVELVMPGSAQWHAILDQEKFSAAFTLDLFLGRSFLLSKYSKLLPRNTFLYLNVAINNILDNRDIKISGYENPRFDHSGGYANKFAPRYAYAYGRNFFVNLSLKL